MSEGIRVVVIANDIDSTNNIANLVSKHGKDAVVIGVALGLDRGAELVYKRKPMVVILDMCAYGSDSCIRWIETILHRFPQTAIFAVSEDGSYESMRNFMRAGATEYFLKPVSDVDLSSALKKLGRLKALPKSVESKEGKIYSVFSAKNGVGATTIAVNLAAHIYKLTQELTVIVDLDLIGGDVATFLHMKPSYTMGDISRNIRRLDMSMLQGIMARHNSGIYVLAAPHNVEEGVMITRDTVRKVLNLLRMKYKHIIVDTEANLTQATTTAVAMSDVIFLTFVLSLPSIKNTQGYLNYLGKEIIRSKKFHLIANRYLKNLDTTVEDAEKILRHPIFWRIPNDFNTAMLCLNKGVTLETVAPRSKLNLSLKDLAMTVTGKAKQLKTKNSPFSRLFNSSN